MLAAVLVCKFPTSLPTVFFFVIVITSEAPAFGMLFRHLAGRMPAMEVRIPMQLVALLLAGDSQLLLWLGGGRSWREECKVSL